MPTIAVVLARSYIVLMKSTLSATLVFLVLGAVAAEAQETPNQHKAAVTCPPIELPVNIVNRDGRLLRNLKADQFTAEYKHGHSPKILSVGEDSNPRRVLLVLETGSRVPAKILAVEAAVVTDLLSEARPEDSFALVTARGAKKELRFGVSREAVLGATKDLTSQNQAVQGEGVLDALLEGTRWFSEARPGDSVLLLTLGFDSDHKVSYREVQKELTSRRLRLFSIQFAPGVMGTVGGATITKSGGKKWFTPGIIDFTAVPLATPNSQTVDLMSWASGGYAIEENILGDPQHDYEVTDKDVEAIKTAASRMQSAIVQYYVVRLDRPGQELNIGLTPDIRKRVPSAQAIYSRQALVCSTLAVE
jgi:hypothetical protein